MTKRRISQHLVPGKMTRPDDSWCDDCNKSSIWVGPVWSLRDSGVSPWGTVRKCTECNRHVWTNNKGEVIDVPMQKDTKASN